MVATTDLKSVDVSRPGSIPGTPTNFNDSSKIRS